MFQDVVTYLTKARDFLEAAGHGNAHGVLNRVVTDLKTLDYIDPGLEDQFHDHLTAQRAQPEPEPVDPPTSEYKQEASATEAEMKENVDGEG